MKKIISWLGFESFSRRELFSLILHACLIIATLLGCFFMLQYSTIHGIWELFSQMTPRLFLLNLMTLLILLSVFWILTNRAWLSCLITSCICGIIAVINRFVIQFHTMPLSFLVLKNFKTAMNVVSGYDLTIDDLIATILLVMTILVVLCIFICRFANRPHLPLHTVLIRDILLILYGVAVFQICYFGSNPWKPLNTNGWSWEESYYQYGYVPCTIESYHQAKNVVSQPEGYSGQTIDNIIINDQNRETVQTPDVILILNESFYDLRQITDPKSDIPYMEQIESMDNLLHGYAVVPMQGGGTNNSEYELLTSNSMRLISATPFNYLNLYGANSIVSHLAALGYSCLGSHSEIGLNYSRSLAYPALGFQRAYFQDDFTNTDTLPGRWQKTDESLYNNLFRWYEESPEDSPRFLYLLTIQNHGNWNISDAENDIVHAGTDYGENTELVNEFLTCIYYSDQAFQYLTNYFAQVERPVIVCMVGDHAPSFASSIADESYSEEERNLKIRSVPLLIWANYELEKKELGTMSMNYVVPTLLDLAGIELSPYYSYMLQVKQQIPILSAYGDYYDTDGNLYKYNQDDNMPYQQLVDNYFHLEYHNIQSTENRDLYMPYE